MKAHELAKRLLEMPDYDVEICAHGHRYHSYMHEHSHGPLDIRISAETRWNPKAVPSISIGDMLGYTFKVDDTETLPGPLSQEEYATRVEARDEAARKLGEHNRKCWKAFSEALKENYPTEVLNTFYGDGGKAT